MSVQAKEVKTAKKPRRAMSLERKNSLFGYVFTLPIIIGLAFVYLPVLFQSLMYSFGDINITKEGWKVEWAGLKNYNQALFVEDGFLRTVIESIGALLPQIIIVIIFAFFMSNLLNQKFRGRTVARVIFFIPVIISTGIISQLDSMSSMLDVYSSGGKMETGGAAGSNMFGYKQVADLVTQTLNNADLSNIVLGAVDGLYSVITSSGVQMLIFLAGLQGISVSMYESAKVEGATGWEVFWKISFPMISPLILVNLLYTVIDLFLKSDNAAIAFINRYLDNAATYEVASAFSWIYTIVVILFVLIVFLLVKKLIVYQD